MIIFASKTIKSGREAIWFERDIIIFVPAIVFSALDMIIFGRKKISSRRNTINLLPEKMDRPDRFRTREGPGRHERQSGLCGRVYEMKATAKLFVRSGRICLRRVRRHAWLFPPSRSVSRRLHDPGGEPQIGLRH